MIRLTGLTHPATAQLLLLKYQQWKQDNDRNMVKVVIVAVKACNTWFCFWPKVLQSSSKACVFGHIAARNYTLSMVWKNNATVTNICVTVELPVIRQFCLLVGCLTSQQQASVSQERICSDNFTCCHTEIEVANQTFYLTQSQYTDTGPTSPSADPITPGAWQGSHWSANV